MAGVNDCDRWLRRACSGNSAAAAKEKINNCHLHFLVSFFLEISDLVLGTIGYNNKKSCACIFF